MNLVVDMHVHSRFSRATSRDLDLEHLYVSAQLKGVGIVGTGDFTHPQWFAELADKLEPAEEGLYRLRADLRRALDARVPPACRADVRFLLTVETAHIYKKDGAVRKVHNLVLVPDLQAAATLRERLGRIGNLASDGRPILGLPCRDLLEMVLEIGRGACLIPAHVWTPHFSLFGSMSGYDSLEACYGDLSSHIFALETGLSSDPPMNWRWSALDRFTLVSNSDPHSPGKLAREANVVDIDPSFPALRRALETGEGFLGTIEFFPEEGKYHLDGHRGCRMRLEPEERVRLGGLCPACGKPVTVGVLSRVEALADRPAGYRPERARPFTSLVPLPEVLAEVLGVGPTTEGVRRLHHKLLGQMGNELYILREAPTADVARYGGELLGEALRRMRAGEVHIEAGYDGEYGTVRLLPPGERERRRARQQISLFGGAA
ncbi:MAG: endonuclease Q family protein [Myxococcales bacterium]|nr:endonuclease Q family protein [Myxococcales bacterium]